MTKLKSYLDKLTKCKTDIGNGKTKNALDELATICQTENILINGFEALKSIFSEQSWMEMTDPMTPHSEVLSHKAKFNSSLLTFIDFVQVELETKYAHLLEEKNVPPQRKKEAKPSFDNDAKNANTQKNTKNNGSDTTTQIQVKAGNNSLVTIDTQNNELKLLHMIFIVIVFIACTLFLFREDKKDKPVQTPGIVTPPTNQEKYPINQPQSQKKNPLSSKIPTVDTNKYQTVIRCKIPCKAVTEGAKNQDIENIINYISIEVTFVVYKDTIMVKYLSLGDDKESNNITITYKDSITAPEIVIEKSKLDSTIRKKINELLRITKKN